ncbi:hypothetical protein [Nocardia thailandica]|uniref:hypothetical protein n=1 Tax=Nocardia thailandica TaxID=257275 RepID=UPI00031626D3|nr:hypothetical protein [Nocardia thailandica]
MADIPDCCDIEVIEYTDSDDRSGAAGIIVPREVRINGKPVLVPREAPVTVHEMTIGANQAVQVTLTVFARLVKVSRKTRLEDDDV